MGWIFFFFFKSYNCLVKFCNFFIKKFVTVMNNRNCNENIWDYIQIAKLNEQVTEICIRVFLNKEYNAELFYVAWQCTFEQLLTYPDEAIMKMHPEELCRQLRPLEDKLRSNILHYLLGTRAGFFIEVFPEFASFANTKNKQTS